VLELGGRDVAVVYAIENAEALDEVLVGLEVVDLVPHDSVEIVVVHRVDAAPASLASHHVPNLRVRRVVAQVLHQLAQVVRPQPPILGVVVERLRVLFLFHLLFSSLLSIIAAHFFINCHHFFYGCLDHGQLNPPGNTKGNATKGNKLIHKVGPKLPKHRSVDPGERGVWNPFPHLIWTTGGVGLLLGASWWS
jgi:hypothetical protein